MHRAMVRAIEQWSEAPPIPVIDKTLDWPSRVVPAPVCDDCKQENHCGNGLVLRDIHTEAHNQTVLMWHCSCSECMVRAGIEPEKAAALAAQAPGARAVQVTGVAEPAAPAKVS